MYTERQTYSASKTETGGDYVSTFVGGGVLPQKIPWGSPHDVSEQPRIGT